MEKVYKTSMVLAYSMLALTLAAIALFICENLYIYHSSFLLILRDCLLFALLFTFFFALKKKAVKGSKVTTLIYIGMIGATVCFLSIIVYAFLVKSAGYDGLFYRNPTPAKEFAESAKLLPFYEPDIEEFPAANQQYRMDLVLAEFNIADLRSTGAIYVLFLWFASWIALIWSFILLCGKFAMKSSSKVACIILVVIMILSIVVPNHYIITIPVFIALTYFLFKFAGLRKDNAKGMENPFEDALLFESNKPPMSKKKKTIIWISIIAVIVVAILAGIIISNNNRTRQENETIETLTKTVLVRYQCIGELYKQASESLHDGIANNSYPGTQFAGDESDPLQYEVFIKNQTEALIHLCKGANGDFSESHLKYANDTLGYQWYQDLPGFIEKTNNIRIILSKRTPISTEGDTKMWTYTELNSGVEFIACKYPDGMISIKTTEAGSDKIYSLYIEYYYNAYEKEYSQLREIIRERKRQKEYESDVLGAMVGAALLGGLF